LASRYRKILYEGLLDGVYYDRTVNSDYGIDRTEVRRTFPERSTEAYLDGGQVTDSISHPSWNRHRKGRFQGDTGGPFSTTKWYVEPFPGHHINTFGEARDDYGRYFSGKYSGAILPMPPSSMTFPPFTTPSNLEAKGVQAIARCAPSNPTVDLSVVIGELWKEGIPKLLGSVLTSLKGMSHSDRRKAVAGEYLNYEFGWKPLINDLVSFANAVIASDVILDNYIRNSGKMVRRTYEFPVSTSIMIDEVRTDCSPWTAISGGFINDWSMINKGKVLRTHKSEVRQWFSGAFAYYVPPADGLRNSMARTIIEAKKLYGLSLTPDTLWNLAPWSWFVDWFSNVGDNIANWSNWAIDNQVLLYGYMMEHTFQSYTYTFVGPSGITGGARPPSVTFVSETKRRIKASPYGFGITSTSLSDRQKAIVAALGASR